MSELTEVDRQMEAPAGAQQLTPATIGRFLLGRRTAIQQVASCPNAWRLGFVFVVAAGFAREYDGESLLHEPWHAALPIGASLITSLVLFLMVSFVAFRRGVETVRWGNDYFRFLGLFWMTAPLAWLYAIPVERFMSPGDATAANLWLLGAVAIWRVVLIIRVITVVYNAEKVFDVVAIVMLFSDTVMLIAVFVMPTPIWSIMGGIRLTESERIIADVTCNLKLWGILTLPVWLIGGAFACRTRPAWSLLRGNEIAIAAVSRSSWGIAIASVLIWIPVLPFTQPEQRLRFLVERDLVAGKLEDALRRMSGHPRSDFPPHWDPPPRPGYGMNTPDLYLVMDSLGADENFRPWVRDLYCDKFTNSLNSRKLR
ncbi:MAG: hypothetical protein QF805_22310, partial [Pirellulaceae bacterium]|nr:hypothetical protein [Pirellulaceae bacterium]